MAPPLFAPGNADAPIEVPSSGDDFGACGECARRDKRRRVRHGFACAARRERCARLSARRMRNATMLREPEVGPARELQAVFSVSSDGGEEEPPVTPPTRLDPFQGTPGTAAQQADLMRTRRKAKTYGARRAERPAPPLPPREPAHVQSATAERRDRVAAARAYAAYVAALDRDPLPAAYRRARPRWAKFPPAMGWWAGTDPRTSTWDMPLSAHMARLHMAHLHVPGWTPAHHWGKISGLACPELCPCCLAQQVAVMPLGTLTEFLSSPCPVCLAFRDARPRGMPVCLVALEDKLGAVPSPRFLPLRRRKA